MISKSLATRLAPLTLLALTALPAAALAAEEYTRRRINWFDFSNPETPPMIAAIINFLLLIGVLYLVLRKPIVGMARNRRENHLSAAGEAGRLFAEAEQALAASRERFASLDLEVARLRKEIHEAGKAEIERIAAETEEQSRRMRAEAEARVEGELERLSEEIRAETVAVIVARAEEFLRDAIRDDDHERLSEDVIRSIGHLPSIDAAEEEATRPLDMAVVLLELLFDDGEESESVNAAVEELGRAAAAWTASPELRQTLGNTLLDRETRRTIWAEVRGRLGVSRRIDRFLGLLFDRGRLAELPAISQALLSLGDRRAGRLRAELLTSGPLSEAATERIRGALQRVAGMPVAVTRREEPGLIGGVSARIGDLVVDGSLKSRLARIREEMLEQA